MIRVWFWFASPQMRELQNDADLRTTTRVTFASVPPGRQLTSVDVVKPGASAGADENVSGRHASDAVTG
jgi:hypothetical protein